MIRLKIIFILTLMTLSAFGQDNFYLITKGNLYGYINNTGKTVINPQFKSAGQFSEGLAAVRLNGTYGYIDQTGNMVIKPQFDYALSFQNGHAKVFINDKPFFIDKKGNIIFQHNFKDIKYFRNHTYTVAQTQTNKYCLINKEGKLITDTIFSAISFYGNNVAVVKGLNHAPDSKISGKPEVFEVGAIDTTGKWVIKYGKYKSINFDYNNSYGTAERIDQTAEEGYWTHDDAVLDINGNLKFIIPNKVFFLAWQFAGFYDGLAIIKLPPKNFQSYSEYYCGIINTEGKILYTDTSWRSVTPFTFKRAFAKDRNGKWKLINTEGEQVSNLVFDNILNEPDLFGDTAGIFTNGIAFAKLSNGWVRIDTSGKILSKPRLFKDVDDSRLHRIGDIVFIGRSKNIENQNKYHPYGFWNSKTDVYVEPFYNDIRIGDFNTELIYARKDGVSYYLNAQGNVLWQDTKISVSTLHNLNIDFMNEGYFKVYRELNENNTLKIRNQKLDSLNRAFYYGQLSLITNNYGKVVDFVDFPIKYPAFVTFAKNKLSVIVDTTITDTIGRDFRGIPVYIGNTTAENISFYIKSSLLLMKVQALNAKGEWKDIEFLPDPNPWERDKINSWSLPPKNYLTFLTPNYEGEFKTKLRIALKYIDPTDKSYNFWGKKEITVYSNEYEASVNPGQFWNKKSN